MFFDDNNNDVKNGRCRRNRWDQLVHLVMSTVVNNISIVFVGDANHL